MGETQATDNELFKDLGINPEQLPEETKKLYKSMQADYTRKTQALAEAKKEWAQKEQDLMTRLQNYGSLEQEVGQWREWYKSLEEQTNKDDTVEQQKAEEELRQKLSKGDPDANLKALKTLEDKIAQMEQNFQHFNQQVADSTRRVDKMFNYQAQLTELAGKYNNIDKTKLLEHALTTGQTDLEKAYQDLYREDIIKSEVDKRLKEELAKVRTDGIHSSARPMIVRRSEGTPKSFEEATEAILKERARDGKLGL